MAENENVMLAEQDIQTAPVPISPSLTVFGALLSPAPFTLTIGETYTVYWNNVKYVCTAYDGGVVLPNTVYIGNAKDFLLSGNDEPFIIAQNGNDVVLMSLPDTYAKQSGTHTVSVYYGDGKDPIVLKNPKGENVEYGDYKKIRLTKASGKKVIFSEGEAVEGVRISPNFANGNHIESVPSGTLAKSVVVQKPDALLPENIRDGVFVAGVLGGYKIDTEEKTVAADFSNGDMEVTPAEGKLLEKVAVTKPETLVPANIAKGVDVAGIVGTHSGGDGEPARFMHYVMQTVDKTATTSVPITASLSIPSGCQIDYAHAHRQSANNKSSTAFVNPGHFVNNWYPTITDDGVQKTISYTYSAYATSTYKYITGFVLIDVAYSVPGLKVKTVDGVSTLYATSEADISLITQGSVPMTDVEVLDFSDSQSTAEISAWSFRAFDNAKVLLLPNTLVSIGEYAFDGVPLTSVSIPAVQTIGNKAFNSTQLTSVELPAVDTIGDYALAIDTLETVKIKSVNTLGNNVFYYNNKMTLIDFSECTKVPALNGSLYGSANALEEIRVPTALYDEWIAATNWSNYASKIVPV